MLSRQECRQLRGIAEVLRGEPTPEQLELVARLIDALVESSTRAPAVDTRQLELGGVAPELHPQHSPQLHAAPEPTPSAPPTAPRGVTAAPSSSSDLVNLTDQQKKTEHPPWWPTPGDAIPADFVPTYDQVLADRRLRIPDLQLPSAPSLFADFVEYLWEHSIEPYARRFSLKRRWRQWVMNEHALPSEAPPASTRSSPKPKPSPEALAVQRAKELELERDLAEQERERAVYGDVSMIPLDVKRAMFRQQLVAAGLDHESTGPPVSAPAVA